MKRKQVTFTNPPTDARYEAQHARLARLQGSVHDDEPTPSEPPEMRRNRYDQHTNMVQPPAVEILPPVRSVPSVVDPYAGAMPQTVQNIVRYDANPITRAKAMTMKVHQVTLFLAILTGALMLVLQWYPSDWTGLAVLFLWLALASVEWIAVFCLLAILDYRETPGGAKSPTDGRLHSHDGT